MNLKLGQFASLFSFVHLVEWDCVLWSLLCRFFAMIGVVMRWRRPDPHRPGNELQLVNNNKFFL